MTPVPVPIHIPWLCSRSPPSLGLTHLQVLVLGACSQVSAAVWGWHGSVSPTLPHSSPLAAPTLLPFPAGHAAWESTGKPEGGDGGFCISSYPWNKPGCPQSTLGWHCCHRLSLAVAFSPGVGGPGFGVSPIFPGTSPSSAAQRTAGACVGAWPAHRDTATGRGGTLGVGSAGGLAWGVRGREMGVLRAC